MFCQYCGTQNPEGAVYCKNCGRELNINETVNNVYVESTPESSNYNNNASGSNNNGGGTGTFLLCCCSSILLLAALGMIL